MAAMVFSFSLLHEHQRTEWEFAALRRTNGVSARLTTARRVESNLVQGANRSQLSTGRNRFVRRSLRDRHPIEIYSGGFMNGVIYLVGLIVVIMAILSFFGLH
jgi:hypothetical protein